MQLRRLLQLHSDTQLPFAASCQWLPSHTFCVGSQVIGAVSGDGRVVVRDSRAPADSPFPVDLNLEHVLGDMPDKTFEFKRLSVSPRELQLPKDEVPLVALEKVLRLPAVGSKRFLTTKVDRCVTGDMACFAVW